MSNSLHPTEGARFLLERLSEDGARASYRASIYTPDAVFSTTATLADDGAVELAGPTGAPAELEDKLAMFAKLTARGAVRREEDGLARWPARVLRWRGPGR